MEISFPPTDTKNRQKHYSLIIISLFIYLFNLEMTSFKTIFKIVKQVTTH